METESEGNPESLPSQIQIHEIPGEPAVVINGVPPVRDGNLVLRKTASRPRSGCACFGEWLEGREVRKPFGGLLYNGKVTAFDKETGWYRVVYEDGDLEDLEWHELERVLLPLDITVPLKTLASKAVKKKEVMQKLDKRSGKPGAKLTGRRR